MKIVALEASNFKRLRAVEITPDGTLVVVAGRNAQGKTSVLDAIWAALGGGAASKDTSRPVRDGEDRAEVRLDLGDLVVTRTWAADGKTKLTVTAADGAKYSSPQAVLDGLVGRMSFDPMQFALQPEREQLATLLDLVDLPFDPEQLDAERARIFDERTVVNREVKRLEGHLAELPNPTDPPVTETSSAEILAELERAMTVAREQADAIAQLDQLRQTVADLETRLNQARNSAATFEDWLAEQEPPADVDEIKQRLADVDLLNDRYRQAKARQAADFDLQVARNQSDDLTDKLATIDRAKAEAIAAAAMPIDGLGFDDTGVTYQGVPFKQASAAEQLRVSIAMAMAMNPTIRVIRITDGSLLDSSNMALIEEMAAAGDFQVWVERVDETGAVGVTIEDGQVVPAYRPETEAADTLGALI